MRIAFVVTERPGEAGAADVVRKVLDRLGTVTAIAAPPGRAQAVDDAILARFRDGGVDLWVFFQAEAVAARLLPFGLRGAVIVPAPDAALAAAAWGRFVASRVVTFSFAQHSALQAMGVRSHVFAYWPAAGAPVAAAGADPAAFFHERRPLEVPNVGTVVGQCDALGIARLAVLAAADRPGEGGGWDGLTLSGVAVSAVAADDAGPQQRAAVVFAPTLVAPIAGSHLDAMARGQVVVAADLAPANEAIGHLSSGLLFDPDRPQALPRLTPALLAELSAAARARASEGRRAFEADLPRLASVIAGDGERWPAADPSAGFLREAQRAVRRRRIAAHQPGRGGAD